MLGVPYSHITFTLPHGLNGMARRNKKQIYGLLMRTAWKTIKTLCEDPDNVGALPGMTAVLHTWGGDLKYHVHVHCLVTFGGLDKKQEWRWPRRKRKMAPYRKLRGRFRALFLRSLKRQMLKGEIRYHQPFEELHRELIKKEWVVNHQWPTAETKVIEEYLGRYICRIAISNKRLSYDANSQKVRIQYNDYAKQQSGQPAPKAFRQMDPLVAMSMILQHQLPAYFQKVRHYGLHAGRTYEKNREHLPEGVKRNGASVRTLIQILRDLLKAVPFRCTHCGATHFEVEGLAADAGYLRRLLKRHQRSPPAPKDRQTAPDIKVSLL